MLIDRAPLPEEPVDFSDGRCEIATTHSVAGTLMGFPALVEHVSWGGSSRYSDREFVVVTAPVRTGQCPVPARAGIPSPQDLPRLLTGAPVQWGSNLDELTHACGPMPVHPMGECASPIVQTRETRWPSTLTIPSRRSTTLSFHRSRGLFEVMVYSDARPFALAAAMEQHLGPPHHIGRVRHTWAFPEGAERPSMRLKVTGLHAGDQRGSSVVRLFFPPTYDAYHSEMVAAGCR